ncbi:AAA family ATPase [Aquitalea sp. ASV15]|uniref:AAA family ATPase n=1 Tax=Aquitalea sp. ASV15 TaxID=2795104 RepID=UPI0018EBDF31|nr:AAA family ATPase [Aquitalea sp. ASV15]
MRFLRIQIKNLFSYRDGRFEFPEESDSSRNVILIHGRNGFGKTSFINALKLFFLGYADSEIRVVARGRQYSARDYMLGGGPEWEGAFNRRALADKEKVCSVSVTWREPQGTVVGTRSWTISGPGTITEKLEIEPDFQVDDDTLDDPEQRQEFLEKRLPRALVPFFIYDAEQVQRIAESNSEAGIEQIERLLDITAINTADSYLSKVLQKLRRESNARGEQYNLESLRGQYEVALANRGKIENDIEIAENDDADYRRRITELTRRLASSKAAANEQTEGVIKGKMSDKQGSLEELSSSFLESFPEIAPLVSHPHLVSKAVEKLKQVSQGKGQFVEELRVVLGRLPSRLFDEPQFPRPVLTEAQTRFFKQKAELLIESEIELATVPDSEDNWSVSIDRARRVEDQLRGFIASSSLRESFASQLREISKLMRDELALEAQLKDLSNLPESDRQKQNERRNELQQLEGASRELRERIGAMRDSLIPLSRSIEKLRSEVNYQERRVSEATRNQVSVTIAEKALAGVRLYKSALKESRRNEIQDAMNLHLKTLLDSSTQIHAVQFDEDFKMTYLNSENEVIGMANISAGMKQIAAQAFLWALKDVARSTSPVVIDTPLARIDAGHQKLLITKFYPAAAEQVIVLPTDSELDVHKYALLKPFISAEFRLNNPNGDSTDVESDVKMYDLEAIQ